MNDMLTNHLGGRGGAYFRRLLDTRRHYMTVYAFDVHYMRKFSNFYLISHGSGLTLIDTGANNL